MKNVALSKTSFNSYGTKFFPPFFIKKLVLLYFCFSGLISTAQDNEAVELFEPHHSVSLLLGHAHTGQGTEDGKKKWLILPSCALDYNYFFSKKWSLGLHNDLIVETFKVADHETNDEVVERTRPITSVVVISVKPGEHFSFELGAGGEFAKEGNYFLNRLGVEYALELPHKWELISNITYDLKWQAYNSFAFSIGVGKAFGFRKK